MLNCNTQVQCHDSCTCSASLLILGSLHKAIQEWQVGAVLGLPQLAPNHQYTVGEVCICVLPCILSCCAEICVCLCVSVVIGACFSSWSPSNKANCSRAFQLPKFARSRSGGLRRPRDHPQPLGGEAVCCESLAVLSLMLIHRSRDTPVHASRSSVSSTLPQILRRPCTAWMLPQQCSDSPNRVIPTHGITALQSQNCIPLQFTPCLQCGYTLHMYVLYSPSGWHAVSQPARGQECSTLGANPCTVWRFRVCVDGCPCIQLS